MTADPAFLNSLTRCPLDKAIDLSGWKCDDAVDWFLREQAHLWHDQRANTVTCWLDGKTLVGFVTTSMDQLLVESPEERDHMGLTGLKVHEQGKHYKRFPALLIGVLGVHAGHQGRGIGRVMVNFSIDQAKTGPGCRFVKVDSYNTPDALRLYERTGFVRLDDQDPKRSTIAMYYDLGARP